MNGWVREGRLHDARFWLGALGALVAMASLLALTVSVAPARAGTQIYVTTAAQGVAADGHCSLAEAIYAANLDDNVAPSPSDPDVLVETECAAGDGADTIVLLAGNLVAQQYTLTRPEDDYSNYTGPTATPMIRSEILIEGLGARISHYGGTQDFRAFAVGLGGKLTLREVWVRGFEIHGGDGRVGGGGGMGAGGAVYVHGGTLVVDKSTFEQNGALGGDGSLGSNVVGGGGGGLGGNGGDPFRGQPFVGGGGGGGSRGNGGSGDVDNFAGGAGGGGGGTVEDGESGDDDADRGTGELQGGARCGGAGGHTDIGLGSDDGENAPCFGGGGGGGESYRPVVGLVGNGDGGNGNYGGGGGGAGYSDGSGGHGGFGGGGGGGSTTGPNLTGGPEGGNGGFGGGGGAGHGGYVGGPGGEGGTFAGDGHTLAGGGGAGLGGAIFGHEATITVVNSTFVGNYANRGRFGGGEANDGRGAGGALFLVAGSLSVNNSTFSNNQTGEFTTGIGGIGGGAIVVYKPTTGQATSLTLRNSILAGNGPHECYLRGGPSTSGVGNLITDNSPNNQGYTVCPGVVETADPGLEPLALNPNGRTPTMKLPAGSSAIDKADAATSEQIDQRLVLRPKGAGFDIGAYEAANLAPTTTIALTPAEPNGTNGWYTTVGVSITASDPDGTIAQIRCVLNPMTAPAAFADLPDAACGIPSVPDGNHTVYAASIDDAGATSPVVSVAFKSDATPPTLNPQPSSDPIVVGQTGVTMSPNASDAPSGVASQSCGAVDTSTPGVRTVTCTATDNAGNTRSVEATYVVQYRILGFFVPVPLSKWKVGQTVPIKVALGDAAGTRIDDSEAAALAAACRVTFSASGAQTAAAACMRYDLTMRQFVHTWKLAKRGTGMATISVSVGYPGTSVRTTLSEQIQITP